MYQYIYIKSQISSFNSKLQGFLQGHYSPTLILNTTGL
uniref:Uncharacterized protein n=1 Tax=Arundo donax TaxID=35708 RepID=A0A0A8XMZ1_ARUDO